MKYIRYILTSVLAATSLMVMAAKSDYNVAFYDRWSKISSKGLIDKAYSFLSKSHKIDSALVCYTIVANRIYEKRQDEDEIYHEANAMNDAGYMYLFYYFDYQKAYSYFIQALNLSKKYELDKVEPYIYLNLANMYRSSDEAYQSAYFNDLALQYYKKAFYKAYEVREWKAFSVIFYGLGHYAYKNNKIGMIKKEIDTFNHAKVPTSNSLIKFDRLFSAALTAYAKRNYAEALKYFEQMNQCIYALDTPERYHIMTWQKKADVLSSLHRDKEAAECLKEAERIALKYNARDLQVDVYKDLYTFYIDRNNKSLSDKYQLIYLQKKDSLLNHSKLRTVGEMQFLNELHYVNDKVKDLYAQRKIQTILLIVVSFVMITFAVFFIIIKKNYKQLRHNHEQLYRKNVETLAREEEERKERNRYEQQLKELKEQKVEIQHNKPKRDTDILSEEDKESIRRQITDILEQTDKICSEEFSLNRLAELLGQKYWFVSHAINEIFGKNFNSLLNEYRIKEACRRLNDIENFGNYTIEAISIGVGFKSRPNFINTFKTITGLTPSVYQKLARRSK